MPYADSANIACPFVPVMPKLSPAIAILRWCTHPPIRQPAMLECSGVALLCTVGASLLVTQQLVEVVVQCAVMQRVVTPPSWVGQWAGVGM